MLLVQLGAVLLGLILILGAITSGIQTFVVPRAIQDRLTRFVFRRLRPLFGLVMRLRQANTYEQRDEIMALYAPIGLLMLPVVWLLCVLFGYSLIYWALGMEPFAEAIRYSGSSLTTLGFDAKEDWLFSMLAVSEAVIGLLLLSLLIAYLPTIYAAFAKREVSVTRLEARAGVPPSAYEMIVRASSLNRLELLHDVWVEWEVWFAEVEESHTSLATLNFFRSPIGKRHWVTAAGAVLDAAAFRAAVLDLPRDVQAEVCIRAGYLALRHIADFFRIPYPPDPLPTDPISVTRAEFDEVYDALAELEVPLRTDRDQAWRDFAGWRVNYDQVLVVLAGVTMAPYAPWSSDRSVVGQGKVRRRWVK